MVSNYLQNESANNS